MSAVATRLRDAAARVPGGADALLAGALATVALAQALVAPIASLPVGVVIALGTTVPVAWRRTRPIAAALIPSVTGLIPSDGYVYVGYVVAFIVFYSVSAHVADRATVVAVVAAGVGLAVAGSAVHGEYFGALSAVAGPAVVGRFVRHQRAQTLRLERLSHELEQEREHRVASAVTEERARIARELHDVIAHEVSVIAIQSEAAEAALEHDATLARAPLETIRSSAGGALSEMRRLLGVLRADGDEAERVPQPGIADIPALVEQARALGIDATLTVAGTPVAPPASVDLTAYRIVQEALTNVRKHAPGARAGVVLTWHDRDLAVEVRNDGPAVSAPTGGGH